MKKPIKVAKKIACGRKYKFNNKIFLYSKTGHAKLIIAPKTKQANCTIYPIYFRETIRYTSNYKSLDNNPNYL